MKNNTSAMLATISLALGVASLISYIDPAVCAGSQIESIENCTQAANQHILGSIGFFTLGAGTLIAGTIRSRIQAKARNQQ